MNICSEHGSYVGNECLKCEADAIITSIATQNLLGYRIPGYGRRVTLPIVNDPNVNFRAEKKLLQIEEPREQVMSEKLMKMHETNSQLRADVQKLYAEIDEVRGENNALKKKIALVFELLK